METPVYKKPAITKTISFDADKLEKLKQKARQMNVPTSSYIKMKLFEGLIDE